MAFHRSHPPTRKRRTGSASFLLRRAGAGALLERELSLLSNLDVYAEETYRTYARNLDTGAETELGEGTSLVGVALADGDYSIRVECDRYFWWGARFSTEYRVSVASGVLVAAPLPEILNLAAAVDDGEVSITWSVELASTDLVPEEFAIWVGASSPVSVAGAADGTVAYAGASSYLEDITDTGSILYVAVRARTSVLDGPVSEVAVAGGGATALDDPSGTSGRTPDGEWSQ